MVKTKCKSTRDYYNKEKYNQEKSGNEFEDSVEYPTWQYYDGNITMVRQINKIFVYKQVYFMYAL